MSEDLQLNYTCWLHGAMIYFFNGNRTWEKRIVFFETLEELRPLLLRLKGSSQRR